MHFSLVHCHLLYCNLIWGGADKSNINSLYLIQKKRQFAQSLMLNLMLTLCHYLNLLMSFRYQNLSLSPSCNLCILMFTIFCHHLLKMFGPLTGKEEKQKISQDSEVIRKYSNHLLEPILLVICPLLHCQNFGIPLVMTTLNLFVTKMSSTVN